MFVHIVLTPFGQQLTEELMNIVDREMSSLDNVWFTNDTRQVLHILDNWNEEHI
ncbi:MAG: hypothetical protein VYA72_03535 [Bacteroidota bacterium]|nr:hypothetical protein [Bacteroidota bacterium]